MKSYAIYLKYWSRMTRLAGVCSCDLGFLSSFVLTTCLSEAGEQGPLESRNVCSGSNDDEGGKKWIMNEGDVDPAIEDMMAHIISAVDEFQNMGSGFKWEASLYLEILVEKRKKGTARSKKAGHYLTTPTWVKNKHAVLNMKPPKQHDDKCFAWVLLRARYPLVASQHGGIQYRSITDLVDKLNEVILPAGVTYPIPLRTDVCFSPHFVLNFSIDQQLFRC
jgi:hypothetical protein